MTKPSHLQNELIAAMHQAPKSDRLSKLIAKLNQTDTYIVPSDDYKNVLYFIVSLASQSIQSPQLTTLAEHCLDQLNTAKTISPRSR